MSESQQYDNGDDVLRQLLHYGLHREVRYAENPYLTTETLFLRLCNELAKELRIPFTIALERVATCPYSLGQSLQHEIRGAYESTGTSIDDQLVVDRILSRDYQQSVELVKFANCWTKHNPVAVLRWFAVDGFLGTNPKHYLNNSFKRPQSPLHQKHIRAVRGLYSFIQDPNVIRELLMPLFANDTQPEETTPYQQLYLTVVDNESDLRQIASWKMEQWKNHQQQQSQGGKRKAQDKTPSK